MNIVYKMEVCPKCATVEKTNNIWLSSHLFVTLQPDTLLIRYEDTDYQRPEPEPAGAAGAGHLWLRVDGELPARAAQAVPGCGDRLLPEQRGRRTDQQDAGSRFLRGLRRHRAERWGLHPHERGAARLHQEPEVSCGRGAYLERASA